MFTLWVVKQVHNVSPRKKDLHELDCSFPGFHDIRQLEGKSLGTTREILPFNLSFPGQPPFSPSPYFLGCILGS